MTLTRRGGLWTFLANLALCVEVAEVMAILADQLTLSQPEGADYVHQITTGTLVCSETIQMNDL
jgi:hypothetical protein